MVARLFRATLVALAAALSLGAGYRTANFVIDAPTPELAREIGESAEQLRRELAIEWLGKEMPRWSQPCMLTAQVAPNLGAGGATSFVFDRGEVFGWRMNIQGSRERLLDSVLPHEITHTVFACHFRQALPRWADEGACTTVEHPSEKLKQQQMLLTFLKTGRGIPFSQMFAMKEYPQDVMPLYSQGYSLARFLIGQKGKAHFLEFIGSGLKDENWPRAVQQYYDHTSLLELQETWLAWVKAGSPDITPDAQNSIASSGGGPVRPASNLIYRGQSADPRDPFAAAASARAEQADAPLVPVPKAERAEAAAAGDRRDDGGWRPAGTSRLSSAAATPASDSYDSVYLQSARPQSVQQAQQIVLQQDQSSARSLPPQPVYQQQPVYSQPAPSQPYYQPAPAYVQPSGAFPTMPQRR